MQTEGRWYSPFRRLWSRVAAAFRLGRGEEDPARTAEKSGYQITLRACETHTEVRVPSTDGNLVWDVESWTNSIRTSQYRWWNFFILNLIQQIIIPSNTYFLVMAVLQMIKPISDSGGVPTFLVPIAFVFLVTMLKDGWEDSKRHRSDRAENESLCRKMSSDGKIETTKWSALRPGDLVVVYSDEQFPADMVLISCSDPYGISYLETVQLDGETNLKDKTCLSELVELCPTPEAVSHLKFELTCMPPDVRLYTFNGSLRVFAEQFRSEHSASAKTNAVPTNPKNFAETYRPSLAASDITLALENKASSIMFTRRAVSKPFRGITRTHTNPAVAAAANAYDSLPSVLLQVNINQFLWRGTTLSNTEWAVGLVVYTGHETRILKSSKSRQLKYSTLLKAYNGHAIMLACTQFALCFTGALISAITSPKIRGYWYLDAASDDSMGASGGLAGFLTALGIGFGRYCLLLSYFIPITLFVQLEIVKFAQAFFMGKDRNMISPINNKAAEVHTVSLVEELGCVTHIFSDKTGTLTLNLMQLRAIGTPAALCGVGGPNDPSVDPDMEPRAAGPVGSPAKRSTLGNPTDEAFQHISSYRRQPNDFADFDSFKVLQHYSSLQGEERERARDFLMVLSLCHSVLIKKAKQVTQLVEASHVGGAADEPSSTNDTSYSPTFREEDLLSATTRKRAGDELTEVVANGDALTETAAEVNYRLPSSVDETVAAAAASPTSSPTPLSTSLQPTPSTTPRVPRLDISPIQDNGNGATAAPTRTQESTSRTTVEPYEYGVQSGTTSSSPASRVRTSLPRRLREEPTRQAAPSSAVMTSQNNQTASATASQQTAAAGSGRLPRVGLISWTRSPTVQFDASSPDELALVSGAMHLGFEFIRRPNLGSIEIALTTDLARDYLLTPPLHEAATKALCRAGTGSFGDYFFPPGLMGNWHAAAEAYRDAVTKADAAAQAAQAVGEDTTKARLAADVGTRQGTAMPTLRFDVLEVLDFDNVRKKMSVIVRNLDGTLRLLSKGADSSMVESAREDDSYVPKLNGMLDQMSRKGLRTLVFGYRDLTQSEVDLFRDKQAEARIDPDDEAIIRVYNNIERNLTLVGCTGIDDRLQPEVPETIEALRNAGIKLWVLTGDKLETAISIGNSCNVLTPTTYNAIVDGDSDEKVRTQLHQYMAFIVAGQLAKDAFDQLLRDNEGEAHEDSDDDKATVGCGRIVARTFAAPFGCFRAPKPKNPAKSTSNRPLAMAWDDFVRTITFRASHQPVVSQPQQTNPVPLTPKQVDVLINEYLSAFARTSQTTISSAKAGGKGKKAKGGGTVAALNTADAQGTSPNAAKVVSDPQHQRPPRSVPSLACFGEVEPLMAPVAPAPEGTFIEDTGCGVGRSWTSAALGIGNDVVGGGPVTMSPVREQSWEWRPAESPETAAESDAREDDEAGPPNWSPFQFDRAADHQLSPTSATMDIDSPPKSLPRAVERYDSVAITCTGEALGYVLGSETVRQYFFGLANLCATVIACRVTPKQKAEVVKQSSVYLKGTVSLGVGDGANDVGMIITADVGVGISGKEGMQAVRAADFAIGEFRFLRNLLFLHGHENLRRNGLQVYHTLYKNVLFGGGDLFYGFWSTFSASDMYSTWLKQIYNLLFTSIPPVLFSVFDRMLPSDIFLACPWLYPCWARDGKSRYFGKRRFINWFLYGLASSFCIVWLTLYTTGVVHRNGKLGVDLPGYGHTVYYLNVIAANFALCPFIHTWFWFLVLAYILAFLLWYTVWWICSCGAWFCSDLTGTLGRSDAAWSWHLSTLFIAVGVIGVSVCVWYYAAMFHPSAPSIIRERIARGVFDVVVAPRARGGLVVVVPRREDDVHWRGFAFSEATTRLQLHRRLSVIPRAVVTQTAALGNAAGGLLYGGVPPSRKQQQPQPPSP